MILHAAERFVNVGGMRVEAEEVPPSSPNIPCTAVGCMRCKKRLGGYQFRWYSHHWLEDYLALMREGSWAPSRLWIGPDPRGTGKLLWEDWGEPSDSSDSD